MKRRTLFLVMLALILVAGCNQGPATIPVPATATAAPAVTPGNPPTPTAIPEPARSPWPTATAMVVASATPEPTEDLRAIHRQRPTATPTSTPGPRLPVCLEVPTPSPEEWKTCINTVYKYQFRYPPSARISEAEESDFALRTEEVKQGITVEDVYEKYTGKICVSIQYRFGYVNISAPPNKYFAYVICGRTGVGAYTVISKEEVLVIDGKTYTAKGTEVKGPGNTLDYHNETFVVTLEDGTTIGYGARLTEKATFEDYLTIKGELLKIVESFSSFK